MLVWDGECSFCRYWVTRWQSITGTEVDYLPYHLAAEQFPDIEVQLFRQASRLIDTKGRVYSGPSSAYRTLYLAGKFKFLDRWYESSGLFQSLSDRLYQFVADRRNLMFRITKLLWGSDPLNTRPFWVIYLVILLYMIYII